MLTNFKELKAELLEQDPYGMRFSSDTDTEVVAKMAQSIYQQNLAGGNSISLREIVEQICLKLVRQRDVFQQLFFGAHYNTWCLSF